jgi:Glycosyltransferase Family 4
MAGGKLNVLQVCDHLGSAGSRMHGVTRLFAWMFPRFDQARYSVSLVSLRKKDPSEETLDSLGVDISYLHKSTFDPATLTALLKIIDHKAIDILHLHGYGATTFGRAAGAMRRVPAILHEHADLTDTSWFQRLADRALEPFTDIALADSPHTAAFVVNARLVPPRKVRVTYPGVGRGDGDLDAFVRKMERLYAILHDVSRSTHRRGVAEQDLSFLAPGQPA